MLDQHTIGWLVCTQSNLSILNHERIMKEKDVVLEQHEVLIPLVCVNDKDLNSSFNKTTKQMVSFVLDHLLFKCLLNKLTRTVPMVQGLARGTF